MRRRKLLSIFVFTFAAALMATEGIAQPAAAAKQISKDEVFFSLGRRINAISESPVSAVVSELDGVIEVTGIFTEPDGKAIVTVKERTPSSAAYTNKSTRLKFAPPATGDKWTWIEFEENRKFYPVDKLFPYAKDELGKRKQATAVKWTAFVASIVKQGESANKALETAKVVIKSDPAPMATLAPIRASLAQAMKDNDNEGILSAYRDLAGQADPVISLGDAHTDLKANDAYLRLIEEFKNSVNVTNAARKDYVQSVDAYNEALLRLPFALVAYGLQFTKIEANVSAE